MLVSCPSCGKRISDRAPACPFCKATTNGNPPAESAPSAAPDVSATLPPLVPVASAPVPPGPPAKPFPPEDDPTATLPPGPLSQELLAALARPSPAPALLETVPPAPPSSPPSLDRLAQRAAEHFNAGRFEDALTTIDRLLGTEPRNGEALNTRAQALFKLGRREEAAGTIAKAIEASPDSLPSWHSKAVMEQEEGKAKQACRSAMDLVEISQHTLTESPLVDHGRLMIATFEASGAFPSARGYLGWLGLGCASMKAGRAESALEFFDRAIDAASANAGGYRWKGLAFTQLGQLEEALILLDTALEIAPNDPDIHHDRGIVFAIQGDSAGALEAFDAALAADPHHALAPGKAEARELDHLQTADTRGAFAF
jgi:tetratricopeptide (TPR) repeat protein